MRTTAAVPRALARILTHSRPARLTAGGVALAVVAAGSLVWATPASAAVPAFPENIVVFPDRDFVSIEGYETEAGKTMTVTVTRNGQVTGRGEGTIAAGGVALEVNHPGGVCWGTGAGAPNVTPDIQAGDVVSIAIDGTEVADSTSIDAAVGATPAGPAVEIDALDKTVLRIRGHVGPGVNTAQLEQRIIAPDLRPLIGRRDVRAVPGPRTTEPRGQYDSALEFTPRDGGNDFVATYWFAPTDPSVDAVEVTSLAAAGGVRIMGWLVEDLDANRQGLTISEFGEPGGPGFGGCPNGPALSGPPAPVVQSLVHTSSGTGPHNYVFTWTPAVPVPGTPAITGYRVRAVVVSDSGLPLAEQAEFGKRVNSAAATGTTLSLDTPATGTHYEFEISSVNAAGNETNPPVNVPVTPPDTTGPVVTTSPSPALTTFFGPVDVTLVSESGADLYYLVTDPALVPQAPDLDDNGVPSAAAEAFVPGTPIHLTATSRVSVIGVDAAGNIGAQADFVYNFQTADLPAAPTGVTAQGAEGQATVSWTAPADPPGAPVLDYTVEWTGPTSGSTTATGTSKTVTGLSQGTYDFTVKARNAAGTGPASAPAASASVTEKLVVSAGADVTATRGGAAVTLNGSGTTGATFTWTQVTTEAGTTEIPGSQLLSSTSAVKPTVTVPALTLPQGNLLQSAVTSRNAPLYFKVTVTKGTSAPVSDVVKVNVATDTVSIATARFRAGQELRVTGSASNPAATVRIYRKVQSVTATTYTFVGTATLVPAVGGGATYDFRLRPPSFNLVAGEQLYAFSTLGGSSGAFSPSIG